MAHRQNYMEMVELNKQRRVAAGLVSERFPKVSNIVIHMTYYQKGANPVLMVRIVNVIPTNYAYFNMECMIKGCSNGGFDLTSVINDMIKNHKKSGKGKLVCNGKSELLASDHASISYEISIQYNK
ncbi:MAG: hypothetical protein FJ242_00375 [Nitrospira sp.]|nr:hypothetical protein [Nitrospira sp.]